MRIGVISDIHANLVSFEAVLGALDSERVDTIICLGDVAAIGPQPHEAIERLRLLNCPVIMGNTDAWLLDPKPTGEENENAKRTVEINLWCRKQLQPTDLDFIRSFSSTYEIHLDDDLKMLCYHGSPKSNTDGISATTPDHDLERMLSGCDVNIMAGAHTHTQMLRHYRDQLIINPGTVGSPYKFVERGRQVRNPPSAEYAIVGYIDRKLQIDFCRIPIDANAIVHAAHESGMPHAASWAADWTQV